MTEEINVTDVMKQAMTLCKSHTNFRTGKTKIESFSKQKDKMWKIVTEFGKQCFSEGWNRSQS